VHFRSPAQKDPPRVPVLTVQAAAHELPAGIPSPRRRRVSGLLRWPNTASVLCEIDEARIEKDPQRGEGPGQGFSPSGPDELLAVVQAGASRVTCRQKGRLQEDLLQRVVHVQVETGRHAALSWIR